jgi:DNA-binding XRE family transcriptional regulator
LANFNISANCSLTRFFCYFVGEPERPPYGKPVSEAVRRLAKNVRLLRVAHGWSQETLAERAGLDRTFVGAVERAERNVTLATAEKLAKAFDLTIADLLAPYDINR